MPPLSSMTGFGSARGQEDWGSWSIEAKSVNGKSLDVRVSFPSGLDLIERYAKAAAAKRFNRGNLQVAIRLEISQAENSVSVNTGMLEQLLKEARQRSDAGNETVTPQTIATLMTVRGVVEADTPQLHRLADDESVLATLKEGVDTALDSLSIMRVNEGSSLTSLLRNIIQDMSTKAEEAAEAAKGLPELLRDRLTAQLSEIGAADQVDGERLAAETAILITKADVREELDRLGAHLDQAESFLTAGSPCGRKLEFLSQEFGREINTLCSKSSSLALTKAGLALKALNDQFKEQAANVE